MVERGGSLKGVVSAVSRWWKEARSSSLLTSCEYWVFLPTTQLPAQDDVMSLLLKSQAISSREGILFSDVRLQVSLVLRSKNPHAFRPDLYSESASPTAEILERLSRSVSFARVRYISDVPLPDDRHLVFMPQLALAYGKIGSATVVFDVSAQRLETPDGLAESIAKTQGIASPEFHVNVAWLPTELGGAVETYGMCKLGLPELRTLDCLADQRILVSEVMRELVTQAWESGEVAQSTTVTCYGDAFQVSAQPDRRGPWLVRIHRGEPV